MSTDSKRYVGKVCFFDPKKGWGFINWEKDGKPQTDLFCHFSDIAVQGFKTLKKDQKVSFTIGVNNKGQPKATDIQILQ